MSASAARRQPRAPRPVSAVRTVAEVPAPGEPPRVVHPAWARALPWLAQGTTARAPDGAAHDMGLFGGARASDTEARWAALRHAAGCRRAVHARQVHRADILAHEAGAEGVFVEEGHDGHLTERRGVLLTVSVADCVPVSVVDPGGRRIALLHAGWRGAAAGILERGVSALARLGSDPAELLLHLGPSICGSCYEVGPEVFEALGAPAPAAPTPIDLRAALVERALAAGLLAERVTVSAHCTRCEARGGAAFHSHRGGDPERQVAFLGMRA